MFKQFKEFASANFNLSTEDVKLCRISQLDLTVNIEGTFCSFNYDFDYNIIKEMTASVMCADGV